MLTIAIPLYNRPLLSQQVIDEVFREPLDFGYVASRDCVKVIISVDAGGSAPSLVYDTYGTEVQVIHHQGRRMGINQHILWLLRHARHQGSGHTLLIEEDTVPQFNWRDIIAEQLTRPDVDALALHPDLYMIQEDYDSELYLRRHSYRTSSWGILLSNKVINCLLEYAAIETRTWDYSLNRALDLVGRDSVWCMEVPYTRHIGTIGTNYTEEKHPTEVLDKAYERTKKLYDKLCGINQPSNTAVS